MLSSKRYTVAVNRNQTSLLKKGEPNELSIAPLVATALWSIVFIVVATAKFEIMEF